MDELPTGGGAGRPCALSERMNVYGKMRVSRQNEAIVVVCDAKSGAHPCCAFDRCIDWGLEWHRCSAVITHSAATSRSWSGAQGPSIFDQSLSSNAHDAPNSQVQDPCSSQAGVNDSAS